MTTRHLLLLIVYTCIHLCVRSQSALPLQNDSFPSHTVFLEYIDKVSSKAEQLEQKLDCRSAKALQRLKKQEEKIERKLARKDSTKAAVIFGNADERYQQLEQRLQKAGSANLYNAALDTLGTSLKFLQHPDGYRDPQWLASANRSQEKLSSAISKVNGLGDKIKKAEEIKKFLKERKQYLKDQLAGSGFGKELKRLNKEVYYYGEQVKEYKELLKDHSKAEKKAIALLSKTKLFKNFMRKHSQLASLFRLPGDPDDPSSPINLAGLQTRAQVNNLIQQQLAAGGPGAQQQFTQNMQEAQSRLNELKNKILKAGQTGSDSYTDTEGFKPNSQKTKTFLQRLEFGTNIQSQKANGFFPATSDIGLSLGYKLNDKSIVGIGASYKLGWGRDIRHIRITHQGIGLRSFADWKIKGGFWISGGYEMNYRTEISNIDVLRDLSAWQQSGLIGISKVIPLRTKFLKKTKLQLLWDFMSYRQVPRTQPILFRVGYIF